MALRLICLAICTALVIAIGCTDPIPPRTLERQNLDTDSHSVRRSDGISTSSVTASSSGSDFRRELPGDVVATDYPFAPADIEQLLTEGEIQIDHPGGGLLRVSLRDVRQRDGTRVLRVLSEGLPGVITQRGEHLIGTLATRAATYNLSVRSGGTRQEAVLIDQRQLDMRIIPNQQDFGHAPAASRTIPAV